MTRAGCARSAARPAACDGRCRGGAGRGALRRPPCAVVLVGYVVVDQRAGQLVGELARALPQPRRRRRTAAASGSATSTRGEQLLQAVGVERVALQPLAGEEERGERLERQPVVVGVLVVDVGRRSRRTRRSRRDRAATRRAPRRSVCTSSTSPSQRNGWPCRVSARVERVAVVAATSRPGRTRWSASSSSSGDRRSGASRRSAASDLDLTPSSSYDDAEPASTRVDDGVGCRLASSGTTSSAPSHVCGISASASSAASSACWSNDHAAEVVVHPGGVGVVGVPVVGHGRDAICTMTVEELARSARIRRAGGRGCRKPCPSPGYTCSSTSPPAARTRSTKHPALLDRHDRVGVAVQHQQRGVAANRSACDRGRPLAIAVEALGQRADQRVGVVPFEAVAALGEVDEIGHRVRHHGSGDVPGAAAHHAERGEPTGRAADHHGAWTARPGRWRVRPSTTATVSATSSSPHRPRSACW